MYNMEIREFTSEQLKNLSAFLDRVPMTGKLEAAAMMDICQALNKPLIDLIKKNKVNKKNPD